MRRSKLVNRVLAAVLSAGMIISMAPVAYAAEEEILEAAVETYTDELDTTGEEVAAEDVVSEEELSADTVEETAEAEDTLPLEGSDEAAEFDGEIEILEMEEVSAEGELELAAISGKVTISVEKYDADGNGTYLVEPTLMNRQRGLSLMNYFTGVHDEWDDYDGLLEGKIKTSVDSAWNTNCTGIADVSQADGYLDNGDMGENSKWVFFLNNEKVSFDTTRSIGTDGATIRAIFSPEGTGYEAGANKDTLLDSMTGLTVGQKNSRAYRNVRQVALNPTATSNEISEAKTALTNLVSGGSEPYVYFEYADGSVQEADAEGNFSLSALDQGWFRVDYAEAAPVWDCMDKISVWNPVEQNWESKTYHWWVDDETGAWQPSGTQPTVPVKVTAGSFSTSFAIKYQSMSDITALKVFVNGNEVNKSDKPYEVTGTVSGVPVTAQGFDKTTGNWRDIPVQALEFATDDLAYYNFRFVGNQLVINRAGTHTMTVSLKGERVSASFTAICHPVMAESMEVVVPEYFEIGDWQDNGQHYVGIRPWSSGEEFGLGYPHYEVHVTPENATNRDVIWESLNPDIAEHSDLHGDGIIPKKAGTARFIVTNTQDPSLTQEVTVTFVYKNPLESAEAEKAVYQMTSGSEQELSINFNPTDTTEQRFTWTCDNAGVVEVSDKILSDESGMTSWTIHKIKALKDGVVTVTGVPYDQTAGCEPVTFNVVVGEGLSQDDIETVLSVHERIANIGDVTLASETAINAAKAACAELTDSQKTVLADDLAALNAAESKLTDVKAADAVDKKIAALGTVSLTSESAIGDARAAYNALTDAQKALVTKTSVLTAAEAKLAKLKKEEEEAKAANSQTVKKEVSISLNCTTLPLQVNQSTKGIKIASSTVEGDKIQSAVTSNKKIATVKVKNGTLTVTGKKKGTANITVTSENGGTATVKVKVQKKEVVLKKLTAAVDKQVSVKKGGKAALKVTKTPFTAKDTVTWTSSNKKVATVTAKGVVKGVKKGTATITAKAGEKTVKFTVTVK